MLPARRIIGAAATASVVITAGLLISPAARDDSAVVVETASASARRAVEVVRSAPGVVEQYGPASTEPEPVVEVVVEPEVEVVRDGPPPAPPTTVETPATAVEAPPAPVAPEPVPEPATAVEAPAPVEPLPFLAYECDARDNDGNLIGLRMTVGIGGWIGDDHTGQDPWAPVRGDDSCVGLPGYETPGVES